MKIQLCIPFYGDLSYRTVMSVMNANDWAKSNGHHIETIFFSTSATPYCFNNLLNQAIHSNSDYFVLLHSDMGTNVSNWLDVLSSDMQVENLAVISAVAAIKSDQGITSVAVDTSDVFPRRLTLKEIHNGPPVLTNEKCKRIYGKALLINTGMMVWDMKVMRPIAHEMPFEFKDCFALENTPDGIVQRPQFIPEDWLMSKRLDERGIAYGATRNVPTIHKGSYEFDSAKVWGEDVDSQWIMRKQLAT